MDLPGALLAQTRPANTTAATAYTASMRTEITSLLIANTTAGAIAARVFLHNTGSTMDESTALYYDKSIPANDTVNLCQALHGGLSLAAGGTIGVRTASANGLTFSIFGRVQPAR